MLEATETTLYKQNASLVRPSMRPRDLKLNMPNDQGSWQIFFASGAGGSLSRTKNRSGTRCAHQFWPQGARSAARARAKSAAGPAAGQAVRVRARIQPKSGRASSQISEFRSCMHSVSWIHARAGGWEAAHAMEWARLPGRRKLPNMFEKPAARKLKCARSLRSIA